LESWVESSIDSDEEGTMYGIVEGISSEESESNSSDVSVGVGTLLSLISRNFIFSYVSLFSLKIHNHAHIFFSEHCKTS